LNGNGDTVAASIRAVLSRIVDDGSKQQTNGDGQLIGTDDSTTDPLRSGLRLVQRNWRGIC
jgi:hypothetical protein